MTRRAIDRLNAGLPEFIHMLGGRVVEAGSDALTMSFDIGRQFCHSGDIVQGGFITAMLDAAMSHAVFMLDDTVVGLSSLEISTRYLEVTRAGPLAAVGRIVRLSYKTAFLDGQLFNADGKLLATTHSVAKLTRKPAPDG
jgi:uncharacterized protein (TIGR00369 family)